MAWVPWAFLAVSAVGAWFTWNAFRPIYWPAPVAGVSFFAGWLTAELPFHHLMWQALATAGFVWEGALGRPVGWAALALTLLSWIGLAWLGRGAFQAGSVINQALSEGLGPSFHEPPADALAALPAAALEWRRLSLPRLMRHGEVERVRDVAYADAAGPRNLFDVYRPRSRAVGCPTLVFVHGGAWVIGRKDQQGLPLMNHLASRGWVCFGINYRLSPRATFPDPLVDVKRAIRWVKEHGAEYGADPDFVILAGGSAGGHLAALAALTANEPAYQPGFEDADASVSGCVPLYGVYDFEDPDGVWPHAGMKFLLERWVMKASRRTAAEAFRKASPIRRVHADAPPFLVIHGALDSVVPVEEARRFVAALRAVTRAPVAYAEIPGAQHAFEVFPSIRGALVIQGIERFGNWLQSRRAEQEMVPRPEGSGRPVAPTSSGLHTEPTEGWSTWFHALA